MEVVYTNNLPAKFKNDDIVAIYGDVIDLMKNDIDVEGIIYDDNWTVRRFLKNYHLRMNKRIESLFNYLDLDLRLLNVKIKDLSKTDFKFVLVAYLLLNNKKIIIFDHFDVGLTYKDQKKLIKIVRNMKKDGIKILFISKDLVFLNQFVDSIMIIEDGNISFNGKMDEIFSSIDAVVSEPDIIKFINLANKRGAGLEYTLDSKELLKDIYRSVS